MIRRLVLLRLRPEHQPGRTELATDILRLLLSRPMVATAEVAVWDPSVEPDHPGWDLVITVHFDGPEQLEAYGLDEPHARFVQEQLVPRVSHRSAFNLMSAAHPGQV